MFDANAQSNNTVFTLSASQIQAMVKPDGETGGNDNDNENGNESKPTTMHFLR